MDETVDVPVEPSPRDEYRRLPPRITPEEMVPVQPLARLPEDVPVGSETEWQMRMGGGG